MTTIEEEIKTRKIGYAFSVTIEREIRTEKGVLEKVPPFLRFCMSASGHADSFEEAKVGLEEAKRKLLEVTGDAKTG